MDNLSFYHCEIFTWFVFGHECEREEIESYDRIPQTPMDTRGNDVMMCLFSFTKRGDLSLLKSLMISSGDLLQRIGMYYVCGYLPEDHSSCRR
jgi:hypothetical protein